MKAVIALLALLFACRPDSWEGIPPGRVCGVDNPSTETVCIAEGKVYWCVRSNGRMLCSRDTVEIKCTNIVNVETVCPGKP